MNHTARILGEAALVPKRSAVDAQGAFSNIPIDGVRFRPARPVPHEDGYLTEVARADWELLEAPIVQVHVTTTFAGRIRAWGLHERITDRLFVVSGLVRIVVFDPREDSPTYRRVNEFMLGEKNPGLLVIPPQLYHGWKSLSDADAVIINMPDKVYDYEAPDALHMSWDSDTAKQIIPHRW
jgi:dTDP-4-dehydrorhamnose 3,5-epimerase